MFRNASIKCVVAALAACCAWGSSALGELQEQIYTYHQEVLDLQWESTYTLSLDLDQFDTFGGTRDLLAVRFKYSIQNEFTATIHDNLTADLRGAEVLWWDGWTGTFNNGAILPVDPGQAGTVSGGAGFGAYVYPYESGAVVNSGGGAGWTDPAINDPAYLTLLTGTGTATIQSEFWISNIDYFPPMFYPDEPPIFDPSILDIDVDKLYIDLTMTYVFTPEPGTAVLVCLGVGAVLIRRPRHAAA